MKKLIAVMVLVLVSLSLCLLPLKAAYTPAGTLAAYKVLRATSTTDDTGLAAAGAVWTSISTIVYPVRSSDSKEQKGIVAIRFKGVGATATTMNWVLYAVKESGEPAQFVAYGTAEIGTTATGVTDEYYANTITITVEHWLSALSYIEGYQYNLGTGEVASGGIALVVFDSYEHTYLILKMSKGTCTSCGADYTVIPTLNN